MLFNNRETVVRSTTALVLLSFLGSFTPVIASPELQYDTAAVVVTEPVPIDAVSVEALTKSADESIDEAGESIPDRATFVAQVGPGIVEPGVRINGVIVVDSDVEEAKEAQANFVPRQNLVEREAASGQKILAAGTQIPVVCTSALTSKTAEAGDLVEARLKYDLKINGKLIAPKGAQVSGHVFAANKARRLLFAELNMKKRWMRANGSLGVQFDEIITPAGEHLALAATPAQKARVISNKNAGRILGVNKQGELASPLSIQLKHQGVHLAIRGAAATGGVFSMGALPLVMGLIGAADPAFAYMHPVGRNVRHRRLKGFGMGFVSGLPGGFILADYMVRGVESEVKPGDEFTVVFKQDFTGEPATSAQLMPGAATKVTGEVLTKTKTKKSKKKKR